MQPNLDTLADAVSHRRNFADALKNLQQSSPDREDLQAAAALLEIEPPVGNSSAEALAAARDIAPAFPAIREALFAKINACLASDQLDPVGDVDESGYWKHELRALDRLDAEVLRLADYAASAEMDMSL